MPRRSVNVGRSVKGTWIHSSRAAQALGVSRDELTGLIEKGAMRADLREAGPGQTYWVYVPDVQYCGEALKSGGRVETLVERGVFPAMLAGYPGARLVEWARMVHRHDLLSDDRLEPSDNVSSAEVAEADSLSIRVEQLERAVAVLLATLSPSGTGNLIPSDEKEAFLSRMEAVLAQPLMLHYRDALGLLQQLQGLEPVTLQDLADWCLRLGTPGRYLVVREVARILLDYFGSLPSAHLSGSSASRTLSLAKDLYRRCTEASLGIESLYKASVSRQSGATPLGYCRTDHNLLDTMRKRVRIGT